VAEVAGGGEGGLREGCAGDGGWLKGLDPTAPAMPMVGQHLRSVLNRAVAHTPPGQKVAMLGQVPPRVR
jgi:hypothetical protein